MGFIGTSISQEDAEVILTTLAKAYSGIPQEIKSIAPNLDYILEQIPEEARKYTLEELIKLLSWANKNGIIF
ncbi:MAG: hypothetical protein OH316_00690 [Candidatus Parvarchaeota archaeon]|nr:hypothetical protein [Candidatus Parvarchaeota archaeon]MCW1301640.1 hypothetical protein [Candidatus Parvarchaeota archaeon]